MRREQLFPRAGVSLVLQPAWVPLRPPLICTIRVFRLFSHIVHFPHSALRQYVSHRCLKPLPRQPCFLICVTRLRDADETNRAAVSLAATSFARGPTAHWKGNKVNTITCRNEENSPKENKLQKKKRHKEWRTQTDGRTWGRCLVHLWAIKKLLDMYPSVSTALGSHVLWWNALFNTLIKAVKWNAQAGLNLFCNVDATDEKLQIFCERTKGYGWYSSLSLSTRYRFNLEWR